MSEQTNAAAERSAHVERGPRRIPGESFLVEVSPGVFQIKALAEARAEIERLRAEIVLLEATGAEAEELRELVRFLQDNGQALSDEVDRLRRALGALVKGALAALGEDGR